MDECLGCGGCADCCNFCLPCILCDKHNCNCVFPANYINLNDPNRTTGTGWSLSGNIYTVSSGADVTVTGSNADSQRRITVNGTANITLNNASITGLGYAQAPIMLNNAANLTLTLAGVNTLTAGEDRAGIHATEGTTLTINGTGKLTATGNNRAAGIGSNENGGNITISGGTIIANGGTNSGWGGGAGIGGGRSRTGGNITITGGHVTATGGRGAAGIGGGGEGGNNHGGNISITGGTVNAYGGWVEAANHADGSGAGIGAGSGSRSNGGQGETDNTNHGVITITGGTVNAYGGGYDNQWVTRTGAGIGGGFFRTGGTINIGGDAKVTVFGARNAAGIGAGSHFNIGGNNHGIDGHGGIITIENNAIVNVSTVGGSMAAGIGGSIRGSGGIITINGGEVYIHRDFNAVDAAGIGGGQWGGAGIITINGGKVTSHGVAGGVGIGGGGGGEGGSIIINGGEVFAYNSRFDGAGNFYPGIGTNGKDIIVEFNGGIIHASAIRVPELIINGNITLGGDTTIQFPSVLTILEGATVSVSGKLINNSTIIGNIVTVGDGQIINYGDINGETDVNEVYTSGALSENFSVLTEILAGAVVKANNNQNVALNEPYYLLLNVNEINNAPEKKEDLSGFLNKYFGNETENIIDDLISGIEGDEEAIKNIAVLGYDIKLQYTVDPNKIVNISELDKEDAISVSIYVGTEHAGEPYAVFGIHQKPGTNPPQYEYVRIDPDPIVGEDGNITVLLSKFSNYFLIPKSALESSSTPNNPGNGGDNPGNGGDNPGNGGDNPGNGGDNPGNGGDNPGNGGDNPGNGGDNPGNNNPGNNNNSGGGGRTPSRTQFADPDSPPAEDNNSITPQEAAPNNSEQGNNNSSSDILPPPINTDVLPPPITNNTTSDLTENNNSDTGSSAPSRVQRIDEETTSIGIIGNPEDYQIIEDEAFNEILSSSNPTLILSETEGTVLTAEMLMALYISGKNLTVVLDNGFSYTIINSSIQFGADMFDLNVNVFITETSETVNNVAISADSLLIIPNHRGYFGFDIEFNFTVEQLEASGISIDSAKLYYVGGNREIIEKDEFVINADGSVTVVINNASFYVFSNESPVAVIAPPHTEQAVQNNNQASSVFDDIVAAGAGIFESEAAGTSSTALIVTASIVGVGAAIGTGAAITAKRRKFKLL